jgi:cobalamin transport system ATP-binding protein
MTVQLGCSNLGFSYQRQKIIENISLSFDKGQFIGLIGPNGAGKSTLLKLLMGLMDPGEGEVQLEGYPLGRYTRRDIAQKISLVPQDVSIGYAFSVREIVAMGRNPHLGSFQPESERDIELIQQALEKTDLLPMADRRVDQLSGGERQRVFIARALAQEAPILLMDEPTASLDLCHQLEILTLVRSLTEEGHLAIAAIHDLDMASRFCHRLILISEGRIAADGPPEQVLTRDNLYAHFSIEARVEREPLNGQNIRVTALSSCSHQNKLKENHS